MQRDFFYYCQVNNKVEKLEFNDSHAYEHVYDLGSSVPDGMSNRRAIALAIIQYSYFG